MERLQIFNTPNTELMINRPLVEAFTKELMDKGMDIAIAEGASGGSLIDTITIPGSTKIIHIGGIFYSTEAKISLGVTEKTIRDYGEYSQETAREMALAMLNKSGATFGIATVGQLDVENISSEKYISVAYALQGKKPWVKTIFLPRELRNRRLVKNEIVQCVFSHGLHYLRNNKNTFFADKPSFSYTNNTLINDELNTVDFLAEQLITTAKNRGLKLATIESCTAGAIANALTNISGASQVFDTGWLAYDENVKNKLGVPLSTMANGNVYSLKVAQSMAEAILNNSRADIAIATTGTMETIDTRPFHSDTLPGTIYVAVIVKGLTPFLKKIVVSCPLNKTREQIKIETITEILTFTKDLLADLPQSYSDGMSSFTEDLNVRTNLLKFQRL